MNHLLRALSIAAIACTCGFAQTRDETIDFIRQEIKSFETRYFLIREVSFSPSGDTFTLRRGKVGRPDQSLVIPLKNVDIYTARVRHPNASDTYKLLVRCRGKHLYIKVNNLDFSGTERIISRIESQRQALALERAFARLTELTTGRKVMFATP